MIIVEAYQSATAADPSAHAASFFEGGRGRCRLVGRLPLHRLRIFRASPQHLGGREGRREERGEERGERGVRGLREE